MVPKKHILFETYHHCIHPLIVRELINAKVKYLFAFMIKLFGLSPLKNGISNVQIESSSLNQCKWGCCWIPLKLLWFELTTTNSLVFPMDDNATLQVAFSCNFSNCPIDNIVLQATSSCNFSSCSSLWFLPYISFSIEPILSCILLITSP